MSRFLKMGGGGQGIRTLLNAKPNQQQQQHQQQPTTTVDNTKVYNGIRTSDS